MEDIQLKTILKIRQLPKASAELGAKFIRLAFEHAKIPNYRRLKLLYMS